ncbi:MAG: hypothetical protein AAEJ57_02840, partial [Opitutales bacterium]
ALLVGLAALFIAGCAAFFSVRGIALMFGAETEFMIPVIVMASSLEFGTLMAASFLYRHWTTCPKALRGYLSLAVVVLVFITSIGIYGYLSQAFENTVAMVEGLEQEIVSLEKEQGQYDRQVAGYRESSRKNFSVVEKRGGEERLRLQSFIEDRRVDIKSAEDRKAILSVETDRVIEADSARLRTVQDEHTQRIVAEKSRLEVFIAQRRNDIKEAQALKVSAKEETKQAVVSDEDRIQKANERLATLEASVKVYRDKGPGGLFKNDGIKKANELLKAQAPERLALREEVTKANENIRNARSTLENRRSSLDERIREIDDDIAEANRKVTDLSASPPIPDAGNVKVALGNLQAARASIDERIQGIEKEIADASRKITELSEQNSSFGPDSSEEIEVAVAGVLAKKEEAQQAIIEKRRKIREIDVGSLQFVARAFDRSGRESKLGESSVAWKESVENLVKWFILVIVLVFDPLAVTLVVAFNAILLRGVGKGELSSGTSMQAADGEATVVPDGTESAKGLWARYGHYSAYLVGLALVGLIAMPFIGDEEPVKEGDRRGSGRNSAWVNSTGEVKSSALAAYVPRSAFAVCSFDGPRSLEAVGLRKVVLQDLVARVPFLEDICWEPNVFGVNGDARSYYFLKFPSPEWRDGHASDFVFALIFPLANEGRLREELLYRLDLKGIDPEWRMVENVSPAYVSLRHKHEHAMLGFDENCFVVVTSWWGDKPDPAFLENELRNILVRSGTSWAEDENFTASQKRPFDVALWFDSHRFFEDMAKGNDEEQFYLDFRPFLDFRCSLEGHAISGEVHAQARYFFGSPVLNEKFGTRVASAFREAREGDLKTVLGVAQGELVEIFTQKLDFNTVCRKLDRLDLNKTIGYNSFLAKRFHRKIMDDSAGWFSLAFRTQDAGGVALRQCIDLLIDALDPRVDEAKPEASSVSGG